MRKTMVMLFMAVYFFTISSLGDGWLVEAKAATSSNDNIKIIANVVNVRQEKSTDSKIICQTSQNEIFELLEEGKDLQGKVWYKIDADFGVTGWVAGWLCKKTSEESNSIIKSKPGEFLYNCSDNNLFIKLLLREDYSLKNLLKSYGSSYSIRQDNAYKTYKYKNGITFEVSEAGTVVSVGVGNRSFSIDSVKKKTCDLFTNKGNELVILAGNSLIIMDATNKKIIREYNTGYLEIEDFEIGNFIGDSALELYFHGTGSEVDENGNYRVDSSIYKVSNNDFTRTYNLDSFNLYSDSIKANIDDKVLNLDINIENHSTSEKSTLPDRVFYNTKETTNKNKLLSIDPEWDVAQENGKWYIRVRYNINIVMLEYYWGPPDDNMLDNEVMLNDLARVDVLIDMSGKTPKVFKVLKKIKYNEESLLSIKPMLDVEGALINGPELGMSMEEAYKALGGVLKGEEYSDTMELKGVQLQEFCGEIVGITVTSNKYNTQRGLKVGDSIKKVESLYGKPDAGLSGDEFVVYNFCYKNTNGDLRVNYYRSFTVYYKNGLVSSYKLYQVILD